MCTRDSTISGDASSSNFTFNNYSTSSFGRTVGKSFTGLSNQGAT